MKDKASSERYPPDNSDNEFFQIFNKKNKKALLFYFIMNFIKCYTYF